MKKIVYIGVVCTVFGLISTSSIAEDGGLRFVEKVQAKHNEHQEKAKSEAEKLEQAEENESLQARDQQQVEAKPQKQ